MTHTSYTEHNILSHNMSIFLSMIVLLLYRNMVEGFVLKISFVLTIFYDKEDLFGDINIEDQNESDNESEIDTYN